MAVEVLITRKVVKEVVDQVAPLMVALRSLAGEQPGYISSESLRCIDPPCDDAYLIRSTWRSEDDWKNWLHSKDREKIQKKIDLITKEKTEYRIYEPFVGGISPTPGQ